MNNEKLIEYLRGIVEIETSHYVQSELIKRLKKRIENLNKLPLRIPKPIKMENHRFLDIVTSKLKKN